MKRFTIAAIALLLALPFAHAQQIKGSFTRIITIPVTNKALHGKGEVSFTAPDKLEMTYSEPEGEYLIIDGHTMKSKSLGKAISVNTQKNAIFRKLRNTLLNCITANYEQAAEDNNAVVKVSETDGIKTVTLKARKAAVSGYSLIILDYDRNNLPLRMVLEEFGGLLTEFQFKY